MYFFLIRMVETLHVPTAAVFILFLSLYAFVWLVSVVACGISIVAWGVSLWSRGSPVLLLRISSSRLSRYIACGILVPQPRIKPSSPLLHGGFLTPGPPEKSLFCFFVCAHPTNTLPLFH